VATRETIRGERLRSGPTAFLRWGRWRIRRTAPWKAASSWILSQPLQRGRKCGCFNVPIESDKLRKVDLLEEFSRLSFALEEAEIEYALCGGLAMAVYAFPRATLDIDILIEPHSLEDAKAVAHRLGFDTDVGLMRFRKGATRICRLTKLDPDSPDLLVLDMLLTAPDIQDVWESRQRVTWDRGELPVVSKAGLIKLKSLRLSGQDRDDIKNLEELPDED